MKVRVVGDAASVAAHMASDMADFLLPAPASNGGATLIVPVGAGRPVSAAGQADQ